MLFGCLSLVRVFILRVQNFHYPAIAPLSTSWPMSDSDHPSYSATGTEPIQCSSLFDAVFEQFKGYVDSRLH